MPSKPVLIISVIVTLVIVIALAMLFSFPSPQEFQQIESRTIHDTQNLSIGERFKLPEPRYSSETSVEEALARRRSIRAYSGDTLTIAEVSQLLWAAQGVTAAWGGRTAPSAGALYPLELYVVIGDVEGINEGVYRYRSEEHELEKVKDGDVRAELADAALGQECIADAAIDLVFTAVYERTTGKYKERGIRYVQMEAGHAAQNVCLQAESLDLGTVTVGAFIDSEVSDVIGLPAQEDPLYILPVGRKG